MEMTHLKVGAQKWTAINYETLKNILEQKLQAIQTQQFNIGQQDQVGNSKKQ